MPTTTTAATQLTRQVKPRAHTWLHRFLQIFAAAVLAQSAFFGAAYANTPSDTSIEQLLQETNSEAMLTQMYSGLEQSIAAGMRQAMAGKPLTAEQERLIKAAPARLMEVLKEDLNWARMKPMYLRIYRESFSQEEIDGLLAFYRSAAGRAFVNKMPAVMQKSMLAGQDLMKDAGPRIQAAMQKAIEEAKAAQ